MEEGVEAQGGAQLPPQHVDRGRRGSAGAIAAANAAAATATAVGVLALGCGSRGDDGGGGAVKVEAFVVPEADPRPVFGGDAEQVLHDVELKDVKVAVDAGAEEGLELVGAIVDLELGGVGGGEGRGCGAVGGGRGRRFLGVAEAEGLGGGVGEVLLDGFEGAFGEDVDGVDDVIEEALEGSLEKDSSDTFICFFWFSFYFCGRGAMRSGEESHTTGG